MDHKLIQPDNKYPTFFRPQVATIYRRKQYLEYLGTFQFRDWKTYCYKQLNKSPSIFILQAPQVKNFHQFQEMLIKEAFLPHNYSISYISRSNVVPVLVFLICTKCPCSISLQTQGFRTEKGYSFHALIQSLASDILPLVSICSLMMLTSGSRIPVYFGSGSPDFS